MSLPRLTRHQADVLARLTRLSDNGTRWVALDTIGSRGALDHLVDKGYAERLESVGPRGGRLFHYRKLTDQYVPGPVVPAKLTDYFGAGVELWVAELFSPSRGWAKAQWRQAPTGDVLAAHGRRGVVRFGISDGRRVADFTARELGVAQ